MLAAEQLDTQAGGAGVQTAGFLVEAQKLEAQSPQSLRVMHRESQHCSSLIRSPTFRGLL